MSMYASRFQKRRPARSKEEIAAEKAAKDKSAMTCQCCGRRIFAETGRIAHHGYQRPGTGWQTASCMGARELPFEADRAVLGRVLNLIRRDVANAEQHREGIEAETVPASFSWSVNVKTERFGYGRQEQRTAHFTRADFAEKWAAVPSSYAWQHRDFDSLKAANLINAARTVKHLKDELATQQARFDGWAQTHEFAGGEWRAL